MGKFTCPYCYGEHTPQTCKIKCSFTMANSVATCRRHFESDADGYIPNARKSACLGCKDAAKLMYCPDTERLIPKVFLDGPSLPIALLGAKASGKSNYIGVLINEIRKKMSYRFNCALNVSCNEESLRYYTDMYYRPLYEGGMVVTATDSGEIPPLIFPLQFMDKKNRITNTAALTFYDTAGENLDQQDSMLVFNRYIPNSKGIILLLDPLQIDSIREKLEGKVALPNKNTDINVVLSRVVENIRAVKNLKGTINIPLAVVFTKIDALEKFDILPPSSCLRDESEHVKRGLFVLSDYENCNIEMHDLLENWLDPELLQHIRNFSKCSFFGISALGGVPAGNKLGASINPRRVLDPLLWLLAENNFIKKVKA